MSVILEDAVVETPVNGSAEVIVDDPVVTEPVTGEPAETPTEPIEPDIPDEPTTDEPDAEPEDGKPEEVPAEPVVFDTADPEFTTKVDETLEKYDLPQEVTAVIDAYKSKALAPEISFAPYADYAPENAAPEVVESTVKSLLDHRALLSSVREEGEGLRPNTDQFLADIPDVDVKDWVAYDAMQLPSLRYQGLTKFEEGIADALQMPGDTVQSVLSRYHQTVNAIKSGAEISSDAPAFVPAQLRDAYWSLPKEERDEIDAFDPSTDRYKTDEYDNPVLDSNNRPINLDEPVRQRKIALLAQIQKGIDNDKVLAQTQSQEQAQKAQEFSTAVQTTQEKWYNAFRETVTQDVIKNVKFSENPKLNVILANQNVAFLGQALEPGASGDAARSVLAESGIKFDFAKAQQLDKGIVEASVALAQAQKSKDAQGNYLNPIEVNKANSQFKRATEAFQTFAKDILDQEARLVSTGTAEAVKAEVAKIKVAPKARPITNGVPTQAKKVDVLPAYKSKEWYDRIVDMEEKKSVAYR